MILFGVRVFLDGRWVGGEYRGAWRPVTRVRGLTCWHQWRHDAVMFFRMFFRRIPLIEQITKHFVNIAIFPSRLLIN
jgi:hypothetical protein